MTLFPKLHRHLDPGTTLAELIFGLLMVLTFTLGARLLGPEEPTDGRELLLAAIGQRGVGDHRRFSLRPWVRVRAASGGERVEIAALRG